MAEDESLGALVAQASTHISTLIRSEIELAKAELSFNAKRVGVAAGLFAAAAFILHLVIILASFFLAYGLVSWAHWKEWQAFGVVTLFYLVLAAIAVLIGYRRLKGMTGFTKTARSLQVLKSGTPAGPSPAAVTSDGS
ncbi:phage holin family protein [Streptosporangiaceae bacterium NEAU-GS5]|nr:phage holin family protein [Streptosporangiaceae bacterium NEAU-GS5]